MLFKKSLTSKVAKTAKNLKFTKDHKFLHFTGSKVAKIGITKHHLEHIGTPSHVSLPVVGSMISKEGIFNKQF